MDEMILDEVRRDVFERPKATIDLDYLYSVKRQVQSFADHTNAQLKKNVYQNYSLFIESSIEISTLKEEMRQLNSLLEHQQTAMSKLLDLLNKQPIIQQSLEKTTKALNDSSFRLELTNEDESEVEAEMLPSWFVKSPEDFDVLIAQRNLREAVALAQKVELHLEEYPKCCESVNHSDLKLKIESRVKDLVDVISSELQPATDRSVQGGPRSSITSIQLLRELNLSSRAVKLYLDLRSSILRSFLSKQKVETTTLQYIKQICSIFFQNTMETCNEFKQAFELDKFVNKSLDECSDQLNIEISDQRQEEGATVKQTTSSSSNQLLLFDLVRPIYYSPHPPIGSYHSDQNSPLRALNGSSPSMSANNNNHHNDISSHILNHHVTDKMVDKSLVSAIQRQVETRSNRQRQAFYNLSTYASLTYWIIREFEDFIKLFRTHVFTNTNQATAHQSSSLSMIAESVYHLRDQCSRVTRHCEIDMIMFIEKRLENDIRLVIDDSGVKLMDIIRKLDAEEQWQPLQFQNKAQLTRFFEEMNDVGLNTMPSYMFEDLKLRFTSCKTSFARYFLIVVSDLAKVSLRLSFIIYYNNNPYDTENLSTNKSISYSLSMRITRIT